MNINIIFLVVQVGIIPTIFSLIKLYKGESFYKYFYIYIIVSYITEVITNRLISAKYFNITNIIVNVFFLLEFMILISLIQKLIGHKRINKIIIPSIFLFWLIENTFLHKIYEAEKYFNILSAIILFIYVSFAIVLNLNKNYRYFFKEANILIILTLLFNLSFRILFEFLYYNYNGDIQIIESIGKIYILVNFLTNILFIYCLSCIKHTKKLISSF